MEKNKYIYETFINRQFEEKLTEERTENGEKIQITKSVKKVKPIKVAVLKPDRRKYKEAEIFYAKRLSAYLKEGLLPHSLVSKRYMNDGGPLSEDEKTLVENLRQKYVSLQDTYFAMKMPLSEEDSVQRNEIILEMTEINRTLKEIQNNFSDIFDNTAEAKSKNDTVEWWILSLSMINEDGKDYKSLYGEGDFQSKYAKLEELESKEDDFTNEVIKKLSYFISFWHGSGNDIKKEDFDSAEENYNSNITKYLVEDPLKDVPAPEAVVAAPALPSEPSAPVPLVDTPQATQPLP